jgi:hypothetical protein
MLRLVVSLKFLWDYTAQHSKRQLTSNAFFAILRSLLDLLQKEAIAVQLIALQISECTESEIIFPCILLTRPIYHTDIFK